MEFDWTAVADKKRAVFPETVKIRVGNPTISDTYKTLPKGEPSETITGFISPVIDGVKTNFVQVGGSNYIKLIPGVKYVYESYSGGSGIFTDTFYFFSDLVGNTARKAENVGGYVADGWEETRKRSFFEMLDFAGLNSIKKSIIVGGILLVVVLLIQITSKIR